MRAVKLKNYLKKNGVIMEVSDQPVLAKDALPLFASAPYDWAVARLWNVEFVLAFAKVGCDDPRMVCAAWRQIVARMENVILVLPIQNDEYCEMLKNKGVDYIMPGARIEIAGRLSLVTRHAGAGFYLPKDRMSVNAQQVVLWYILHGAEGCATFARLGEALDLPRSRISNVAQELVRLGLATINRQWKNNTLVFVDGKRGLWNRALPNMVSPIQRKIRVRHAPDGLHFAGMEALSRMSTLAPDAEPTYAIARNDDRIADVETMKYEGPYLEVWKYPPERLSRDLQMVDPLSLFLSLKDDTDPRVQGELEKVLEEVSWQ